MMSGNTELIPDLVVTRREDLVGGVQAAPRRRCSWSKSRSPSTAVFDLNIKKAVYERFGIESYWIVVPDVDKTGTDRVRAV